jgi:phytanoyl-CoA hydroxylase
MVCKSVICLLNHFEALHDQDPVYKEFSYQQNIYKILKDIGYRVPKIVQSMVILKPAKHGGVVAPHQDSTFVFSEKTPCVGFWFALDDATKENACLWGIPGSHKSKFLILKC